MKFFFSDLLVFLAIVSQANALSVILHGQRHYRGAFQSLECCGDYPLENFPFDVHSVEVPEGIQLTLSECSDCAEVDFVGNAADVQFTPVRARITNITNEKVSK